MDKKTAEEMLKDVSQKDLVRMIVKMTACSREAENILIDWGRKNLKTKKELVYETELKSLWDEAQEIISEFNEYGGGPEDEEETASDNLWNMSDIVKEHSISWDVRRTILDEMLYEFRLGNSGFDDQLIDVAEDFCQTEDEIRYLADELSGGNGGYYKSYAAQLYRSIGDEDRFLQTRLENLRYGSDYIEAAKYFAGKGDHKKELEYIWQGLEKSTGRLDELIDYIAPIYRKEKNEKELRRLYDLAIRSRWNLNIAAVARHLYKYAKEKGDYASQKKMLLLLMTDCDVTELKKWFSLCQKELSEKDWKKEYPGIMETIRQRDKKFYLDLCMETGREAEVLKCLQTAAHGYSYGDLDHNGYFSKRLLKKYPEQILALYWRDVHTLLRVANNRNYETAKSCLERIKSLMRRQGKTEEWNRQFAELKETHKKKRNFMALVRDL